MRLFIKNQLVGSYNYFYLHDTIFVGVQGYHSPTVNHKHYFVCWILRYSQLLKKIYGENKFIKIKFKFYTQNMVFLKIFSASFAFPVFLDFTANFSILKHKLFYRNKVKNQYRYICNLPYETRFL